MKKFEKMNETLSVFELLKKNPYHIQENMSFSKSKKITKTDIHKIIKLINENEVELLSVFREDENRLFETWIDIDYDTKDWSWYGGYLEDQLELNKNSKIFKQKIKNRIIHLINDVYNEKTHKLIYEKDFKLVCFYNITNDKSIPDVKIYFEEGGKDVN